MNKTSAGILLILVFMARGTSFLFSKTLMYRMLPMSILAVRFVLSFIILAVIFHKKLFSCDKQCLKNGFVLGVLYTVCMFFEMYGLRLVDTGVSSLIENMAIVLVPLYVAVFTRSLPKAKTMFCAVLAVIGVGFLSLDQGKSSGGSFGIVLIVLAALTYGLCILYTEKVSHDSDPLTIGMIQLGTMGLLSLIASFFTGGFGLPQNGSQWGMMLILVLVCSCFGFAFQPLGQKYLKAENAAVLTVVNPFTASILGIIAAGEKLTVFKLTGYILILTALMIYNLKTQSKTRTYTAALVGTGRIGFSLGFDKKREQPASHTMALSGNRRIKLVAAADTDSEKLSQWGKYVKGAKTFSSSALMYKAIPTPDIITVAVNEDSHMQECLAAIAAKPRLIILEKPVALNSEQAAEIATAAGKAGVPVMVNHERRFATDYNAAKNYIKKIGTLQTVRGELYSGLRIYGKDYEKDGTYSLLHDGTHLVDIISWLLDEKLTNPVVTGIFKDDKGDVRNFNAHFNSSSCAEVTISMSGRSRFFSFGLDILGTEGRICLGNGYAKFYRRKESKLYTGFYSLSRDKTVHLPKKTGYFSNMIQNAVDYLDGASDLKSPLSAAVEDLQILEEIKAALVTA